MPTIAEALRTFQHRPSLPAACFAAKKIHEQRRKLEALFGVWCFARLSPSPIDTTVVAAARAEFERLLLTPVYSGCVTASDVNRYLPHDLSDLLPDGVFARGAAILVTDEWSVVGEYGEGSRLFFGNIDGRRAVECFYEADPLVRHIHSVHRLDQSHIAVCTGDAAKYLDVWEVGVSGLRFLQRCTARLAGYTGAATAGGEHFFGSDFSGRPNFLLRLSDGRKFPYPSTCFTHYTVSLASFEDRYILGLTKELDVLGGTWGEFVFDTFRQRFVSF